MKKDKVPPQDAETLFREVVEEAWERVNTKIKKRARKHTMKKSEVAQVFNEMVKE